MADFGMTGESSIDRLLFVALARLGGALAVAFAATPFIVHAQGPDLVLTLLTDDFYYYA